MKHLITRKSIFAVAAILIAGFIASQAIAHMGGGGYGGGYHMGGYGMGSGGHMMGYGPNGGGHMMGYGGHMWQNLNAEDQQKMHDAMNTFFNDTREIRQQIYEKRVELRDAYAAPEKDQAKIETIQKELYDLSSRFEKERFDHMTKMQKLFKDENVTPFMGGGYGFGC